MRSILVGLFLYALIATFTLVFSISDELYAANATFRACVALHPLDIRPCRSLRNLSVFIPASNAALLWPLYWTDRLGRDLIAP